MAGIPEQRVLGKGVMKVCGRCDQRIKAGEEYRTMPIDSGSGAAVTVYWHEVCPKSAPGHH